MSSIKEVKYNTPSQPRQLRIDSVSKCNASCLSCHRLLSKRKGEMPFELILQILDDVSKWKKPLTEIVPVNYGEIFLRSDWYEILCLIAQTLPFTQIVLPTNGSFLNTESVTKICHIPTVRIINLSVNAYFDETYEAFTGLKAETIPNIRKAVAQFRILRPDITLWASLIFDPAYITDLEKDEFIRYWMGWAIPQILPAASAGRPDKVPIIKTLIPCRSIFSDIVIGYDGKISSCCWDASFNLELGHYQGNLLDNWHGKELTELRRFHNAGQRQQIPLCSRCTFS